MSLAQDERIGAQLPRLAVAPPSVDTAGIEALELATAVGLFLDEWQQFSVRLILGEKEDGNWSAFESGVLVARQNGKGGIIECIELAAMFLFPDRLIMHSAHEFKTAQEGFLRIKALIDNHDELRRQVKKVTTAHGDEGIQLLDGTRLRFVARSRGSGRGFTGDRLILDEAQELPMKALGAALPTMSARPNPQVNAFGTVPDDQNDAEYWERMRDRGRSETPGRLVWIEWSPEEVITDEGEILMPDLDDRDLWYANNPAMGIRLSEGFTEAERGAMDDATFARERLSWWPSGKATNRLIQQAPWERQARPDSAVVGGIAIGFDVAPSRKWASIAVAGSSVHGGDHLELVEDRAGTGWLVSRLIELVNRWDPVAVMVDGAGPARSFVTKLEEVGIEVEILGGNDFAAACGSMVTAINDGTAVHFDQAPLNSAVSVAGKRKVGEGFAFSRTASSANISPLVAATVALEGWIRHRGEDQAEPEIW